MATLEEAKAAMKAQWDQASAGYAKWVVQGRTMRGLYEQFVHVLQPALAGKEGVRILDIASASGEPAASVAEALPSAQVVATDLAESYMAVGAARCEAAGLKNVSFQAADGEDLSQFADASYDAVTISLGLMFMPQYEKCLAECKRVLKPGGLLVAAVWQSEDRVQMFRLFQDVARALCDHVPNAPSQVATKFGDPKELLAAMSAAGLSSVNCQELVVSFHLPAEHWWAALQDMPTPIAKAIKEEEAKGRANVREVAHQLATAEMSKHGWLCPDTGITLNDNACWFITAQA